MDMKEIGFDESKKIMAEMLFRVASFCESHSIDYSVSYGTLIGCIRHKGFIPWDDDIDMIMRRSEYDRFIDVFQDERYEIIHGENTNNHAHIRVSDTHTIVQFKTDGLRSKFYKSGLWIDVFPIDKVPDSSRCFKWFKRSVWLLYELQLCGEFKQKRQPYRLLHYFCLPFSRSFLFSKLAQKRMLKYNKKNTNTVASLGVWYLNFPPFPASYMDEYIDVEFEGNKVKAIKQYDSFLRGIYGDYMKYPPLEKQVPHHDFIPYWKENK